jgi:hypothetical protein
VFLMPVLRQAFSLDDTYTRLADRHPPAPPPDPGPGPGIPWLRWIGLPPGPVPCRRGSGPCQLFVILSMTTVVRSRR